jgi:peptide-methionine (R)-S-oxide reductase
MPEDPRTPPTPIRKSDTDWRAELSPERYRVLREKGTERAFSGRYWDEHREGIYACAGCGQPLYSSEAKFDSGTGWPSFSQPVSPEAVSTETDNSHFMVRTEVHCSRCGGHLGHLFPDGPEPTGHRHCINSASLQLSPTSED